jgi:tRNA modification GTPase
MNDSIIAISTPIGESALGLIRLSGPDSIKCMETMVRFNSSLPSESRLMRVGKFYYPENCLIDEVCVVYYKSPRSYTGEDVVELSCHGNPLILKEIIQAFLNSGLRIAKPGEFTMRAFLNGKIDLTRAEAVNDIIRAQTRFSKAAALHQLEGGVYEKVYKIHTEVMDLLAEMEASIDFDDTKEHFLKTLDLKKIISKLVNEVEELLKTAPAGKMTSIGVTIAIIGAPNTGKSSIMNSLLREDRVIVSELPGTTRDVIHERLNIMGVPVNIFDTAGLQDTTDPLEKKGMGKTLEILNGSDLRIVVFDSSREILELDERIAAKVSDLKNIYILNKKDLPAVTGLKDIQNRLGIKAIHLSALKGDGLEQVEKAISDFYFSFGYDPERDTLITSTRQEGLLKKTRDFLLKGRNALADGLTEEFAASDIRRARLSLEEIIGRTTDELLLDKIFDKFCIGK